MKSTDLLTRNHDLHFHSQISDGVHSVGEVVRYVSRWQKPAKWAGISDHSPKKAEQVDDYLKTLQSIQAELLKKSEITLLAGMELEWNPQSPEIAGEALDKLDYVISSYHGMNFSQTEEVESYFRLVARNKYSDIAGHPDKFLGKVDTKSIHWEDIFNNFYSHEILCEYNLTTPLRKEILDIAIHKTEVNFVISSDVHDFRSLATRRIIDAWSESLGGGFEVAKEYLDDLLRLECNPAQLIKYSKKYETKESLTSFQNKIYLRSKGVVTEKTLLDKDEAELFAILERAPECEIDKRFQIKRLERFSKLTHNRIISLLEVTEFKEKIKNGRLKRNNWLQSD